MRKVDELRNVIANQFASEYKAYELSGVCNAYGIEPDAGLEPMNNKIISANCGNIYFRVKHTTRASAKIIKRCCGSYEHKICSNSCVTDETIIKLFIIGWNVIAEHPEDYQEK